jgi:hypothetical protein
MAAAGIAIPTNTAIEIAKTRAPSHRNASIIDNSPMCEQKSGEQPACGSERD